MPGIWAHICNAFDILGVAFQLRRMVGMGRSGGVDVWNSSRHFGVSIRRLWGVGDGGGLRVLVAGVL